MSRPRASLGVLPDDLYIEPAPCLALAGRRKTTFSRGPLRTWSDPVPITDAALDVFEAWFADLFDELFGPRQ